MKIFLDFDDVLFNTRDFRKDRDIFLQRHGIRDEYLDQAYVREFSDKKTGYSLEKHLGRVKHDFLRELDVENVLLDFYGEMKFLQKYVFSDVPKFIESLRGGRNNKIIILSFGEDDFQRKKIEGSGLSSLVDEVIVTEKKKADMLKGIVGKKEEKVFFLDDRVQYMKEMKEIFPFVKTILVSRPEGRYHDARDKWCDFEVQNLEEAKRITIE